MKPSLVIGVTGGIGSGKSATTDYFASLGIEIVDADWASRMVVEPGRPGLEAIIKRHGASILQKNGTLDRRKLRDIIFANKPEKHWLEQLLHPLIFEQISKELELASSRYVILVSPLMIETSQHQLVNRVLVVDVEVETQVERAMKRDAMTKEQAEAIIRQQCPRQTRLAKADDVVDNSGSIGQLHLQLDKLHRRYLSLATENPQLMFAGASLRPSFTSLASMAKSVRRNWYNYELCRHAEPLAHRSTLA